MITVIIPCKERKEADKCIEKCIRAGRFTQTPLQILIMDDNITGKVVPAIKRDMGAKKAKGEILAFIDSDAYPAINWFEVATRYITDYALGGPSLLPPESSLRERIADKVYRCLPLNYRVKPTKPMFVKEMPTSNLFVKTSRFIEVGGFGCDYLTGEDSILCQKLGGCLYVPELQVYHRRRPIYHPLFKQVATYGKQRGMFFKAYLGTVWSYAKHFISA